ncbi:hypothetical protein [Natronorubrum thiooxidans]|uniref:DUF8151 domain-containing protein n=1 Tax=Natronorubrum thiooxidans TaxID=308853 RepID=A0A1N7GCJ1_9EURY|nr:hypothetical protein [Natronorubrum thiooxidans]SIS10212.1 hypothetical protein SAMN05421752_11133 [Natronorubrum thiooxidans]
MGSATPELLSELLPMIVYTILGGALTAGGIAAEYASLQHLGAGEAMVGLWLAAIGVVMLYGGVYGIGYKKVAMRLLSTV